MKRQTPRGVWALRGVTIAIALLVIIVIGSVAYSAYEEYDVVRGLSGNSSLVSSKGTVSGNTATVSINVTIPNNGLYPINVTIICNNANPNIDCPISQVSIPSGQQGVLRFRITVFNVQQYTAGNRSIPGTFTATLEPFASISVGVDLGGYFRQGGI